MVLIYTGKRYWYRFYLVQKDVKSYFITSELWFKCIKALQSGTGSDFFIVFYFINIKGIVSPINEFSSFTHSQVVLNLNEFLFSVKHKSYFEECGKPKQLLVPSDFPILYET